MACTNSDTNKYIMYSEGSLTVHIEENINCHTSQNYHLLLFDDNKIKMAEAREETKGTSYDGYYVHTEF